MLKSLHMCSGFIQGGFREFGADFGPPDSVRAVHGVLMACIGAAGDRAREIFGDIFIGVSGVPEMVRGTISAANGRSPGGVELGAGFGSGGCHGHYACYRRVTSVKIKLANTMTTPTHWIKLKDSPTSTTAKRMIMTGSEMLSSEARAVPMMLALTKKHK